MSTVRAITAGPSSEEAEVTSIATNASATIRFSSLKSGAMRLSAAPIEADCCGLSSLFRVLSLYFVVACASLRVINLYVFRRCLHQLCVRTRGQNLALHQKNNLVVVFDRSDLLSDGQQCDSGIITVYVLEDLPF